MKVDPLGKAKPYNVTIAMLSNADLTSGDSNTDRSNTKDESNTNGEKQS
jgi:hypothetical protein